MDKPIKTLSSDTGRRKHILNMAQPIARIKSAEPAIDPGAGVVACLKQFHEALLQPLWPVHSQSHRNKMKCDQYMVDNQI